MTAPSRNRRTVLYVRSLAELAPDQSAIVRAVQPVMRRARKGAPLERFIKVTLYSERRAAKILEMQRRLIDGGYLPDRAGRKVGEA